MSSFEQRTDIKFCVKLKKSFTETLALMDEAYEDEKLSRTQVYFWYKRFKDGRKSIADDSRSGRLLTSTTDRNIGQKIRTTNLFQIFYKIGKSASETLYLLKLAFGNENVNKPTTFRWFSRFKNGMESVKDEKSVGRPILHRNPEKVSQISNWIKENQRIGLRDIEEETGISKSLVVSTIEEDLQLKKTPSKFVPKMLTIQQKEIALKLPKKCLKWWKITLIGRKK
ncbi:GVQW3 [Cordylochernes scorpioides]|uniref:GVQW3 n=1 Tax=Cordylochernes scorpioides TaxID=51811 RepID=A0ABY6KDQ4_9ARAC|nr:GVQW3 [Cordylochernes scorpioides]